MVRSTHLRKKTEPRKLRNYNSSRQSLTRTVSALSCLSRSSSRTCLTRPVEVSADELERCTDKSSETQSQSNLSAVSLEQDRTLWRQQYCYATCPSPRTPRRGASEMRYKPCSRWQRFSKQKARPLDVEEWPLKSAMSQPKMKGRCPFISSHPLEEERPRSFSPSTISVDTTRDATLKRIDAVGTGTRRSAVTAPIAAGGTTAMRTGWPRSHQAHGYSAGQSTARRYPAHSNP